MKKNIYTNSIENIKAPESLINQSISKLTETDTESVIIIKKQSKRTPLKFSSIIAATLVILVAIGTVTFSMQNKIEHPFIITVGAEEITPDAYIEISDTLDIYENAEYILHGYLDENRNFIKTDNNVDLLWIAKTFNIGINCVGEEIENVNYKAINGYLSYKEDFDGITKVTPLTTDEVNKYNATSPHYNFKKASECTFDYNNQPRSIYNTKPSELEQSDNLRDGTIPLRITFNIEFKEGECVVPIDDDNCINSKPAFKDGFNQHAEKFGLKITANFKDGTSTTKTLKFKCEINSNKLSLYAIEKNAE